MDHHHAGGNRGLEEKDPHNQPGNGNETGEEKAEACTTGQQQVVTKRHTFFPRPKLTFYCPLLYIPQHYIAVVKRLLLLQDHFYHLNWDDREPEPDVTEREVDMMSSASMRMARRSFLSRLDRMARRVTRYSWEFATTLPGFPELLDDDQNVLLAGVSNEMVVLYLTRCYDPTDRAICFSDGRMFQEAELVFMGLDNYARMLCAFCHEMVDLQFDADESVLLTAACLFSERPGLRQVGQVMCHQKTFLDLLLYYECGKSRSMARIRTQLAILRMIAPEHKRVVGLLSA